MSDPTPQSILRDILEGLDGDTDRLDHTVISTDVRINSDPCAGVIAALAVIEVNLGREYDVLGRITEPECTVRFRITVEAL